MQRRNEHLKDARGPFHGWEACRGAGRLASHQPLHCAGFLLGHQQVESPWVFEVVLSSFMCEETEKPRKGQHLSHSL